MGRVRLFLTLIFVCSFFLLFSCRKTEPGEDAVAQIGETILTRPGLEAMLPERSSLDSSEVVLQTIERWANRELLYREAVRKGLSRDPSLQRQVDDYEKTLYGAKFLDQYLTPRMVVTAQEVRDYYKRNRILFQRKKPEARLLHFLLSSKETALDVKRALLRYEGAVRQELLRTYRVQVNLVSPGDMIPELDRAIFTSRQLRGVVGPVRSPHGYHVLEVLDFYPADSYRGIDEVYGEISQQIARQKSASAYARLLDSLKTFNPLTISSHFSPPGL
ncbi:MAG: peptidyl-prolyl cis-trans isomerase [Fidelibacterota bacterium]